MVYVTALAVGLSAAAVTLLYGPVAQRAQTLGLLRKGPMVSIHGEELKYIPGTQQCEDLHYHASSDMLYAGCQSGDKKARYSWFPPLGIFKDPAAAGGGAIVTVDPKTFASTHLKLKGFRGPLVTHGIDIHSPSDDPTSVYIFVVNHLPNPDHYKPTKGAVPDPNEARSQVELFKHTIGSDTAEHLRSIRHPLVTTPNDVLATSQRSFYVTNDHRYRKGALRMAEDVLESKTAGWTNTVFVNLTDPVTKIAEAGADASIALGKQHNNNGLGHGSPSDPNEVIVIDASGGVLTRAKRGAAFATPSALTIVERIQYDYTLDNPFWYEDQYGTAEDNASGYVLAGLAHAATLTDSIQDPTNPRPIPVIVTHTRQEARYRPKHGSWEKRLVFQDEGHKISSASSAAIVGIDPETTGGKKQGWLFVTGFLSDAMIATKIDL